MNRCVGVSVCALALMAAVLPACGVNPVSSNRDPPDTADSPDAATDACVPEADSAGFCDAGACVADVDPVDADIVPHSEPSVGDSDRFADIEGAACTTAAGDTRVDCADSILTFPSTASTIGYAPRWIGDMDGDGADDLVLQHGLGDTDLVRSSALLYGGRRAASGDVHTVADAVGQQAAGFAVGARDMTGDGQDDVLIETPPATLDDPLDVGMAIHSAGWPRSAGTELQWSGGDMAWLDAVESYSFWPGRHTNWLRTDVSRASASDVDGDGVAELIFFETDNFGTAARASIVRGGPAMIGHSTQWEDATWRISTRLDCVSWWGAGEPVICSEVSARPVTDLDGDGVDEIVVVRSAGSFTEPVVGWSAAVLPLHGVDDCAFDVDDVMVNAVGVVTGNHWGFLAHTADTDEGLAIAGTTDLNGDGLADLILGGPTGEYGAWRTSIWFLYGGGAWLTQGGELTENPDRIDYPMINAPYREQVVSADMAGVSSMDLDGDSIDEVVIGSSAAGAGLEHWGHEHEVSAWVTIIPGTVGGLQGVHIWDDSEFHAISSADHQALTVPAGRGDLDADGFDDLVIMGLGPYQENTEQLGAWIFYGGAIP